MEFLTTVMSKDFQMKIKQPVDLLLAQCGNTRIII